MAGSVIIKTALESEIFELPLSRVLVCKQVKQSS